MKRKHALRVFFTKTGDRKLVWSLSESPSDYERWPGDIPITKGMYEALFKVMLWEEKHRKAKAGK